MDFLQLSLNPSEHYHPETFCCVGIMEMKLCNNAECRGTLHSKSVISVLVSSPSGFYPILTYELTKNLLTSAKYDIREQVIGKEESINLVRLCSEDWYKIGLNWLSFHLSILF